MLWKTSLVPFGNTALFPDSRPGRGGYRRRRSRSLRSISCCSPLLAEVAPLLYTLDLIAQQRRPLELQVLRHLRHLARQILDIALAVTLDKEVIAGLDDLHLLLRYLLVIALLALQDILSGEYMRVMTVFIESNEPVGSEIPQGLYAVKYVKGPYSALDKAYRNLLKEIEAQGYRVVSDAFEEYVIDELATDDEEEYVSRIRIMVERR